MPSDQPHDNDESTPASDQSGGAQPRVSPSGDDEVDRRRLIRWIAALAFGGAILLELFTFRRIIARELFPGEDTDTGTGATATETPTETTVGVGDELLPETEATETVVTSEVRGDPASEQTYVLRVEIENTTDVTVQLHLTTLRFRDGTTVDNVSSSGPIAGGETGEVTGAWTLPDESMPDAVKAIALRDGETIVERFVDLQRPPIRG
jgi:hypothetical protein